MPNNPTHNTAFDREAEITVRDFLQFLWRNRWIACIAALACAIAAATVAELRPPEYLASITLLPVSPSNSGTGLSSLNSTLSQFSGFASLAGINLGSTTGFKAEALATLQSRLLTDKYIEQHNLMPVLFAKSWNSTKDRWATKDPNEIPTLWDADQLFKRSIRTVVNNPKTGLTTMTIRWKNPALAAQWANGLVALANDYLRHQAIDETNREISYLNQEISKTSIVGVKTAIYTLMEQEIKNEMIAKGRKEFALHIIDPAVPPTHKASPKPLLWTIGGGLGGLFLGYLVAVIKESLGSSEQQQPQTPTTSTAESERTKQS